MSLQNLLDLVPAAEREYAGRLVEMTLKTLAHMPTEQRMREYAKSEILYSHVIGMEEASAEDTRARACAE